LGRVSQFAGDSDGEVTGDLNLIIKDLRSKYSKGGSRGQNQVFSLADAQLFRGKGSDKVQKNSIATLSVSLVDMVNVKNAENTHVTPAMQRIDSSREEKAKKNK
jgi:hypothetical protein